MHRGTTSADPRSIRAWNEYAVVDALRGHTGPLRISDLAAHTGLTPAPLGKVLRGLEDKGWVEVCLPSPGMRGRPAQGFKLARPTGYVLGLDVGPHAVRAQVLDFAGGIVASAESRRGLAGDDRDRASQTEAVVREACAEIDVADIWVAGLAIGGHLDADGTVLESVAMPQWEGRHVGPMFAELLGVHVEVCNDVRASTWAEHIVGAAQNHREVLVVSLGRRPTLGILMDGSPRRGAHGLAGDMSRQALLPAEDAMNWLQGFDASDDPLGDAVSAAMAGDTTLQQGAIRYVQEIAPALAFAASVMDPSVVVLAGALAPLAHHFTDVVAAELSRHVTHPPALAVSQLDQYSAARGAALLQLRSISTVLASPTTGVAPLSKEAYLDLVRA